MWLNVYFAMLLRQIVILSALAGSLIAFQQPELPAHEPVPSRLANNPTKVDLFRNRGFGLFIHWGVDGPLAGVISHSLVGASPDYVDRFFTTLPGYFNPDRYDPAKWASLAKLAGFRIRYVHHQTPRRLLHVGYRYHTL